MDVPRRTTKMLHDAFSCAEQGNRSRLAEVLEGFDERWREQVSAVRGGVR